MLNKRIGRKNEAIHVWRDQYMYGSLEFQNALIWIIKRQEVIFDG